MVRLFPRSIRHFPLKLCQLFRPSCSHLASRQALSFALDLNHSRSFTINGSDLSRLLCLCRSYKQRTATLLHSNKENYLRSVETPEISSMMCVPSVQYRGNDTHSFLQWFIGRELNPSICSFDMKSFNELRPGLILWVLINISMLCEQATRRGGIGNVTDSMWLVLAFHTWYVADGLYNEVCSTWLTCLFVVDVHSINGN